MREQDRMMRARPVIGFALGLAAAVAGRSAFAADAAPAKAPAAVATTIAEASSPDSPPRAVPPPAPAGLPKNPAAAPPPSLPPLSAPSVTTTSVTTSERHAGVLREPAPRPATDVRVQSRFAVKAKKAQLFAGAEYLSRGDFYNSPGVRAGATYYPLEAIGVELQASHYWSSLNAEAERVKTSLGALPDSHAPTWLVLLGARYSIGYGKLLVGGLGGAIHFEPQAFLHAGLHAHDGDAGPTVDGGLGLLVFLTPKAFARIDAAIVFDREDRSGKAVSVWGTLPSLSVGGTL